MLTPKTNSVNHLLRLFNNMNYSMFSYSFLRFFLSDPISKQSAISKEKTRSDFQWRFTDGKPKANEFVDSEVETHESGVATTSWVLWTQRQIFRTLRSQTINTWRKFSLFAKKLGITTGYSTFSMEALRTNVSIQFRPTFLKNLEVYKNRRKLEFIQHHTETGIGTFRRDSEMWIRLKAHFPDRHCLMINWIGGQKQKYVSTRTSYCVWEDVT